MMGISVSVGPAAAAEFWFEPIQDGTDIATVTLYGEIQQGDADRLASVLRESIQTRNYYIDVINLFSPGGDAVEGIKLGRVINDYYLITQAPNYAEQQFFCPGYPGSLDEPTGSAQDSNCVCASACAVAWLGGIERHGVAGFHRVYSVDPTIPATEARRMRMTIDAELDVYLSEVGVPDFVEDLIDHSGPQELGFPTGQQLSLLQNSVDHSNTVYAACQAFNMPLEDKSAMSGLNQKSSEYTLSSEEQRALNKFHFAYERESTCREQVRRRELFRAQEALAQ